MSVSAELKEDLTKVVQCGFCLKKFDNREHKPHLHHHHLSS
jgi:hypothetical protein